MDSILTVDERAASSRPAPVSMPTISRADVAAALAATASSPFVSTSTLPTPASSPSSRLTPKQLHTALAEHLRARLTPTTSPASRALRWQRERGLDLLEERFLDDERSKVAPWAARAPTDAAGFVRWFEDLRVVGPGQADTLFPWLAERASIDEMRWFLGQEVAGEAGFDDLVALTQVKLPTRAKLELARNYWDEMGRGNAKGMHGPMLERLAEQLALHEVVGAHDVVAEALALGNLLGGLALDRGYAFQAVGALGVVELTAPDRAEAVNDGLERLGIDGHARQYYALHATLDKKHWAAWRDEVIVPLVEEDPSRAAAIAEGALMRLNAGARCFMRYRTVLGVDTAEPWSVR